MNTCSNIPFVGNSECNVNHVNKIKSITIQESDMEKYKDMMDNHKKHGTPVIIDAADLSSAELTNAADELVKGSEIGMCPKPERIVMPCNVPVITGAGFIGKPKETAKPSNRQLQAKELEAANIPDDKKKLIAAEYMRLCKLHPNWKAHRAMRKAGEKYNVKFDFE
jgi:hypothetical protein